MTKRRDERGSVLSLSAVGMVLAMLAASLSIDLGSLAQLSRELQKVADLAALDAVRPSPMIRHQRRRRAPPETASTTPNLIRSGRSSGATR